MCIRDRIRTAPLVRHGLLSIGRIEDEYLGQWNQRSLLGDEVLFHYLVGQDYVPPEITDLCRYRPPSDGKAPWNENAIADIMAAAFTTSPSGRLPLIALSGKVASGRAETFTETCRRQDRRVLEIDLGPLAAKGKAGEEQDRLAKDDRKLNVLFREALLRDACLLFRGIEELTENREDLLARLAERAAEGRVPVAYLSSACLLYTSRCV